MKIFKLLFSFLILLLIFFVALSSSQEKRAKKVIYRIGVTQTFSSPEFDADAKGFERALSEAASKEGINVIYDFQNARGDMGNAKTIAMKFLDARMDLIHSIATPTSQAVVKTIIDIPIVFSSVTNPLDAGLVPKTNMPGAKTGTNVTGVSDRWPVSLQFQMYTKFFPKAKKWGTIYNAGDPKSIPYIKEMREAAKKLGVELIEATISNSTETVQATQSLAGKVQAIYITYDHTSISSFEAIARICNEKKTPLFAGDLKGVLKGAMAAYGVDYFQIGYSAGKKAIQILKGEGPGDIPWESAEKLLLIINEKAARAQGAIISPDLLKKADKVIQE